MVRRVVIAGWGQATQDKEPSHSLLDPLGLMREASLAAADRAGDGRLLQSVDAILLTKTMSVEYQDPASRLSRALGASPRLKTVARIGGNSPQCLIHKAAGMILRGELDCVLVAGAETYYPRNAHSGGEPSRLMSALDHGEPSDDMVGSTPLEKRHGMWLPVHGFPLFETAFWAESGKDLNAYLRRVGGMWAEFSRTAAQNPFSWTRTPRTTEEIVTPTSQNRYIAFPYTKFMTSLLSVDLGAAVLVMSEETARRFKRSTDRFVYFTGGGYAEDRRRFMIQKSDFTWSPAYHSAVSKALERSGLRVEDLECFDLYSCFPCAVTMGRRVLGIGPEDPRPLTLTGGLGFFGGPGNSYSLHAVAALAEEISQGRRTNGMITALGWFMHKLAAGVYSAVPGPVFSDRFDLEDEALSPVGDTPVDVDVEPSGMGVVETYTVVFSRNNEPEYAILYGKTDQGKRFVANTPAEPSRFSHLCTQNHVGRQVRLAYQRNSGKTLAEFRE